MTATELNEIAVVFDAAADLLKPRGAWTQRTSARNRDGQRVFSLSPTASCWCFNGALVRAAGTVRVVIDRHPIRIFLHKNVAPGRSVFWAHWNDIKSRRKGQVIKALRGLAEQAREEAGER